MIRRSVVVLSLLVLSAAAARGQAEPPDVIGFASPLNIEFMSGPIAFDADPVVGAPYSAEAVTDIVQKLGDGNRIVRQNKAQISRDSEGRTRREQGFAMFGPLVNGPRGGEHRSVQISDPTTDTTVMLDLQSKTAHRMPAPPRMAMRNKIAGLNDADIAVVGEKINLGKFEIAMAGPETRGTGAVMFNRVEATSALGTEKPAVESLGTQFMEGIAVEGTRTTMTIPAGQVGNELPINVVSERWYSPDLKVLVMSRQSDPRFGETTYRLTNLTRAEPPADLFVIPPDFKVIDPTTNRDIVIERRKMVK